MLADGATLVTASGDKLLGGPQAGLLLGGPGAGAALVERIRRHPLARAMRVDKLTLAALEATLRGPLPPVRVALAADPAGLRRRAEALAARLAAAGIAADAVDSTATVGGGGAPGTELPSAAVALPERYAAALRSGDPAVLGRLEHGRCLLDLRAVDPGDDDGLARAVLAVPTELHRAHVVATAGHVDHGKSALVRALTGMEPDRLAEERRRGMTLDLGFAWTDVDGESIAFVDVPGHERFVTTMLAGAGPVPAVLFVVAADEGWMPQSAEHLDALAALGVRHGVLVVTRCDLRDPADAVAEATRAARRERGRRAARRRRLGGHRRRAGRAARGAGRAGAAAARARPGRGRAALGRSRVHRARRRHRRHRHARRPAPCGPATSWCWPARAATAGARCAGCRAAAPTIDGATGVARVALNLRGVPVTAIARGDALLTPGAWRPDRRPGRAPGRADGSPPGADAARRRRRRHGAGATARIRRGAAAAAAPAAAAHRRPRRPARSRQAGRCWAGRRCSTRTPAPLRRRGAAARRAAELADRHRGPRRRGGAGAPRARCGRPISWPWECRQRRWMRWPRCGPVRGWWIPRRVRARSAAVRAAVAAHAAAAPLEPGLPLDAARRAADLPDPQIVPELLRADTELRVAGGRVLAGAPALPARLTAALATLQADLSGDPFAAPDAARLAELGLGPRELATLVRAGAAAADRGRGGAAAGRRRAGARAAAGAAGRVHPQRGASGAGHEPSGGGAVDGAAGPDGPHPADAGRAPRARRRVIADGTRLPGIAPPARTIFARTAQNGRHPRAFRRAFGGPSSPFQVKTVWLGAIRTCGPITTGQPVAEGSSALPPAR